MKLNLPTLSLAFVLACAALSQFAHAETSCKSDSDCKNSRDGKFCIAIPPWESPRMACSKYKSDAAEIAKAQRAKDQIDAEKAARNGKK